MKKFFSLVLALVMALSLTTVAWGANEAKIGTTEYLTLADALTAAVDGDTVTLLTDVSAGTTFITKAITLDLNGKTVTGTADRLFRVDNVGSTVMTVTIKNGAITNPVAGGRCVETRSGNIVLNLNDVNLTATNGSTQAFTVGGSGNNINVNVTNGSSIVAGNSGYGIITFNPVTMTIEDSSVSGYIALYVKPADSGSLGSAGSVFNVNGSTLSSTNNVSANPTNSAGTIQIQDNNITVNIDADSTVKAVATTNPQANIRIGNTSAPAVYSNVVVNIEEGATLTGTILDVPNAAQDLTDTPVTIPAEYADDLAAEGYVVTVDANGQVVPTGYSVAAPFGGTALTDKYDMVTTNAAQTKTLSVTVTTYAAKNPTYNTDGISIVDGNVAYVVFSNLPGKTFVQVNTQGQADYTVYKAGTTTLFGYFDEVVNPFYRGNGVAFYNFGKACTQYKDANFDATASYYTFEGNVYKAVSALDANAGNLMVNNTLVPVSTTSGAWVGHTVAYTYDKDFKVTGVSCSACGAVATIVPNYMSLPEQAIVDGTFGGPINTTMYYYWTNAVVKPVTPTTPSTDKVTSADTFDAGIAMYVGMSVMAAAGSAVVIGKKKD